MPRSTPELHPVPLRLAAAARARVVAHARAQFPYEACGVLLAHGDTAQVDEALPLPNARLACGADATQCYAIAPADMAAAHRHARAHGLQVAGFFHSHPLGDARPSAADVHGSPPWPGLVQLIVALDAQGRAELRAYAADARQPHWHERAIHTVPETRPDPAAAPRRVAPSTVRFQEA